MSNTTTNTKPNPKTTLTTGDIRRHMAEQGIPLKNGPILYAVQELSFEGKLKFLRQYNGTRRFRKRDLPLITERIKERSRCAKAMQAA